MKTARVTPLSVTQLSATQVKNDECAICLCDEGTISSQNFTCGCLVKTHTACIDRWFSDSRNGCVYCRKPTSLRKEPPNPPAQTPSLLDDMLAFYSDIQPYSSHPSQVTPSLSRVPRPLTTIRRNHKMPAININIHIDSRPNNTPPPPPQRRSGYSIRDMIFIGCLSVAMLIGVVVVVIMIV